MNYVWDDGGRKDAGYYGETGDCVVRAIAIACELPYRQVYSTINALAQDERPRTRGRSNARHGVWRKTYQRFLESNGWQWVPTMAIGSGCTVHMNEHELPDGRIIVRLSKHVSAVIDGVIHDTHDPSRNGHRCVYGYYHNGTA